MECMLRRINRFDRYEFGQKIDLGYGEYSVNVQHDFHHATVFSSKPEARRAAELFNRHCYESDAFQIVPAKTAKAENWELEQAARAARRA